MNKPLDSTPGRLRYRVWQFLEAVNPAQPDAAAAALLSPAQFALFRRMRPDAQRHCLAVFRALVDSGERDPELLLAALLHDAGKQEVAVAYRVAAVMLEALWPRLLARLGREDKGWRRGLYHNLRHARRGAELAAAAGATAGAVALIRAHHDPHPTDPRLARLQEADGWKVL